jgi:hypothetical protein
MGEMETMVQVQITIDGVSSLVAQGQDVDDIRRRIEEAAATMGRFVDFVVVGDRTMAALITPTSRVTISAAPVQSGSLDAGDASYAYGTYFDLL